MALSNVKCINNSAWSERDLTENMLHFLKETLMLTLGISVYCTALLFVFKEIVTQK